jgi:hypothetical protein
MAKKFKVLGLDAATSHVLVKFYDDEVLGSDNTPISTTLNVGLHNSIQSLNETNFAEFISSHFPDEKIYPNLKNHDLDYITRQIDIESTAENRISDPDPDYIKNIIKDLLKN